MSSDIPTLLRDGRDRLAEDMRSVLDDAEALLRHAVRDAGHGYDEARERLEKSVKAAKAELASAQGAVLDRARDAGRAADGYVRGNPWQAVGIGAGIGLVLGLLIGRK